MIALGVGVVAAVLFPIMMVKRPNPLIPPWLFRIRNFTVINISTFLIYGALYVTQWFNSLFLQNVLGYTRSGGVARRAAGRTAADLRFDAGGNAGRPDRCAAAS